MDCPCRMSLLPHGYGTLYTVGLGFLDVMKRLTLEFPYQELWGRLFGPNRGRVEVLEATKSLKCDFEGLAVICRIRFRDKRMKAADLVGKGAVRSVETLRARGSVSCCLHTGQARCPCSERASWKGPQRSPPRSG